MRVAAVDARGWRGRACDGPRRRRRRRRRPPPRCRRSIPRRLLARARGQRAGASLRAWPATADRVRRVRVPLSPKLLSAADIRREVAACARSLMTRARGGGGHRVGREWRQHAPATRNWSRAACGASACWRTPTAKMALLTHRAQRRKRCPATAAAVLRWRRRRQMARERVKRSYFRSTSTAMPTSSLWARSHPAHGVPFKRSAVGAAMHASPYSRTTRANTTTSSPARAHRSRPPARTGRRSSDERREVHADAIAGRPRNLGLERSGLPHDRRGCDK